MVKRTCLVFLCSVVMSALAPARADAWWEYIEKLSGPGPFKGPSIEARLVCFVDNNGIQARVPTPLESITASCKLDNGEVRRAAIDLNMRFLKSNRDAEFANGQRINLTTIAPSISWNIIPNRDWDVVDFGVAGGVYWFSSTEFPGFHGAFVEPVRFDIHGATSWKEKTPWAAAIPRVRFSWIAFPAGFEPTVFAPAVPRRISRDWSRNIAIFFDAEAVLKLLR